MSITSYFNYILTMYQRKKKVFVFDLEPKILFEAIDAFPKSTGFWSQSNLVLVQFDYTFFELSLIQIGMSSPPVKLSSGLTGRIEKRTDGRLEMRIQTKTRYVLKIMIGFLFVLGMISLFHLIFDQWDWNKLFLITMASVVVPIGLPVYKDFTDKVILQRFESELFVNIKK